MQLLLSISLVPDISYESHWLITIISIWPAVTSLTKSVISDQRSVAPSSSQPSYFQLPCLDQNHLWIRPSSLISTSLLWCFFRLRLAQLWCYRAIKMCLQTDKHPAEQSKPVNRHNETHTHTHADHWLVAQVTMKHRIEPDRLPTGYLRFDNNTFLITDCIR